VPESREAGLQVERYWIIDFGPDSLRLEVLFDPIPRGCSNHILIEHMRLTGGFDRQRHRIEQASLAEKALVSTGVGPARFRPGVEMTCLDAKNRSLHGVHSEIATDQRVNVLRIHPVVSKQACF